MLWLFTDATEEEILQMSLNPEEIEAWSVNIDDNELPKSPNFSTINEMIDFLIKKIGDFKSAQSLTLR